MVVLTLRVNPKILFFVSNGLARCVYSVLVMLESDCVALFMVSCGKKTKRYGLSQGHPDGFNIEACRACDKIRISHIETEAEIHCNTKTQCNPKAVLWKF